MPRKSYLGDGVYIEMVPEGFVLTTENGVSVTNRIVLDMEVLDNLQRWIAKAMVNLKRNEG